MINVRTESNDSRSNDIQFAATVEELQDLVDKLKDAAKSLQSAGQNN